MMTNTDCITTIQCHPLRNRSSLIRLTMFITRRDINARGRDTASGHEGVSWIRNIFNMKERINSSTPKEMSNLKVSPFYRTINTRTKNISRILFDEIRITPFRIQSWLMVCIWNKDLVVLEIYMKALSQLKHSCEDREMAYISLISHLEILMSHGNSFVVHG